MTDKSVLARQSSLSLRVSFSYIHLYTSCVDHTRSGIQLICPPSQVSTKPSSSTTCGKSIVYMCTYVHVCMGCGVCVRVYMRTCVRCGVVCACAYVCIISRYVIFSTPGPSVLVVLLRLSFDAVSSGHSEIDVQLGNKIKLHGCG